MNNPVGWFEIYVDDIARARAFYESVFELSLTHLPSPNAEPVEMWAFDSHYDYYGAPGALVKMEGFGAGQGGTLIYFSCEDCAVEQARVDGAGGKVIREKYAIGEYGFVSLVEDTEGNLIGLHSLQ